MHPAPANPVDLTFPTSNHPRVHHRPSFKSLSRQAGFWQEARLIRKALDLAGQPNSILDLPCGTGRLWPILLEKTNRMVIGADDCTEMLAVAQNSLPATDVHTLRGPRTSLESIDLPDCAVDSIFCVNLFSRIGTATQRQQLLREFHRVTRDTLILSLWVDGNWQAWRRRTAGRQPLPGESAAHRRLVVPRQQLEAEFAVAGFEQLGHFDLVPIYHPTRIYVLRKH